MTRSAVSLVLVAALAAPAVADDAVPEEIAASVYKQRRRQLMQKLGGCAAAIRSYPGEEGAPDPYFYYLTGVAEPGAMLVLVPRSRVNREVLLLAPRDEEREIWEGYREPLSPELEARYAVDEVGRFRGGVPSAVKRALRESQCWAELRPAYAKKPAVDPEVFGDWLQAYETRKVQRWRELERMRAIHDGPELARMQRAIEATVAGHRAAARNMAAGVSERQLMGAIERAFYDAGGTGLAFPTIVGSGENGAVLHWRSEDRVMREGDLVVLDIGASYGHYTADISRTLPLSGRFSEEQRAVYDAVIAAQDEVIAAVRPGVTLDELNELGQRAVRRAGYELPHSIGHFVGLEVHDAGDPTTPLEAGMVITVEPGIYVKGKLGVRVEDMVLVTERGHRLLTGGLPRGAAEVEAWMAEQRAR